MYYKKSLIVFIVIFFTTDANFSPISYDKRGLLAVREPVKRARKSDPIQMSYEILKTTDFAKLFKDLHRYLSPEEVRIVSTLGLLSGALRVEESMREHLYVIVDDLLDKFNKTSPMENMKKLITIEHIINRDKSVVRVLNEMIKFTRNETTLDNLQKESLGVLKEVSVCRKFNIVQHSFNEFFSLSLKLKKNSNMHKNQYRVTLQRNNCIRKNWRSTKSLTQVLASKVYRLEN